MKSYSVTLFDLDGTLSDPKEGITKSVQYALAKLGIDEPDPDRLTSFIGPPLKKSFVQCRGLSDEDAEAAIGYYRERFAQSGLYENVLYEGVPAMLRALKQAGRTVVLATSKPTVYAERILEYFEIAQYFDQVVGSDLDGTRVEKAEVIQCAIEAYRDCALADFVMVGDRGFDIQGASWCGVDSIGVAYGYGSIDELQADNPVCIVESVERLREVLLAEEA